MKSFAFSSLLTLSLVAVSEAYPSIAAHLAREAEVRESATLLKKVKRQIGWSPSQRISVDGAHAFVAPGSTDQRGPCPGLNALANHNYLPHNGVATIAQFVQATGSVFGMGADLALFLSTYGAVMDGDLTSWSIGGPTSNLASITGLLGTPQGISGSHNKYEGDSSPTRGDLYEYGNDYELQVSQFQALWDLGKADDSYDLSVLTTHRVNRFQQSIENNPYFFYGPFTGIVVTPAAYTFIYRYMSNKSEEFPEGYLNGDVLKSFFSITGEDGNFKYTPGYERIPENWYTRNVADPYGIPYLTLDTDAMGLAHPEFLVPGGNTGTTNSYVGLDPSNLTGGVFTLDNLAKGNNLACFAFQAGVQFLPDLLEGVYLDVTSAVSKANSAFNTVISSLNCPKLETIDQSQFNQYPGYTKLNEATGTYPGESTQ